MKQIQRIGQRNHEQDLKSLKDRPKASQAPIRFMKVDKKPAITNDQGMEVNKHTSDAGKGYNEEKPTDSGADHVIAIPHHPAIAEVPFETSASSAQKHQREEQEPQEDEDHFKKRTKQAEDVRG